MGKGGKVAYGVSCWLLRWFKVGGWSRPRWEGDFADAELKKAQSEAEGGSEEKTLTTST